MYYAKPQYPSEPHTNGLTKFVNPRMKMWQIWGICATFAIFLLHVTIVFCSWGDAAFGNGMTQAELDAEGQRIAVYIDSVRQELAAAKMNGDYSPEYLAEAIVPLFHMNIIHSSFDPWYVRNDSSIVALTRENGVHHIWGHFIEGGDQAFQRAYLDAARLEYERLNSENIDPLAWQKFGYALLNGMWSLYWFLFWHAFPIWLIKRATGIRQWWEIFSTNQYDFIIALFCLIAFPYGIFHYVRGGRLEKIFRQKLEYYLEQYGRDKQSAILRAYTLALLMTVMSVFPRVTVVVVHFHLQTIQRIIDHVEIENRIAHGAQSVVVSLIIQNNTNMSDDDVTFFHQAAGLLVSNAWKRLLEQQANTFVEYLHMVFAISASRLRWLLQQMRPRNIPYVVGHILDANPPNAPSLFYRGR